MEWQELTVTDGMVNAEIIKAKLESESIPVNLRFESAGRIFGITMDGLGKVRIFVPSEFFQLASELLATSPDSNIEDNS